MKNVMQGMLLSALLVSQPIFACTVDGKEGILPENDMNIPVDAKRYGGITEEQFNNIIDEVETLYAPIVSTEGGNLQVERKWDDGTVNAYAQQSGKNWKVSMFGGLARHDTITEDGFALVICHEIGHHIGGAPRKASAWSSSWASNEGQADYFSTLKCLRRVWNNEDNNAVIANMTIPETLSATCSKAWGSSADYSICVRGGMAGDSVARLFADLRSGSPAKFETPDSKVVAKTDDNHPGTQCRLDTYFQGALCEVSMNEDVQASSEVTGTCHGSLGHKSGTRPLCWFKPSVQ
ncbi:MAG TPA: hypothetical protein VNJ08_09735 [Bacteriovoracaceae bacterium]|nr:hypothetical protein [Bacteriovoracaceae bacterium]